MEFGKHLGKGIWGVADKGLPVIYGVAYVVLVIRVLPESEFGNFVLIQDVFLIISGLAIAFVLWPMLKFTADEQADRRSVISSAIYLNAAFVVFCSIILIAFRTPFSHLLNSPDLGSLMLYVPAMLAASFVRNLALILLQTQFKIKEIFWIDAMHFVGAPILIWVASRLHMFDTALDLIIINLISLSASSLVGIALSWSLFAFTTRPDAGAFRKLYDYGKFSLGSIATYLFYTKADSFILSSFSGPVQVAVYNSVKIFVRVYEMVSQVIHMFLFPATSKLSSTGDVKGLKTLVEKSIAFATIGTFPVFILFLLFAGPLVSIYGTKYVEAISMLQLFSVLAFLVPVTAVGSNTLMGLGHAKQSFVLGVQTLLIALAIYFLSIPIFGAMGACIGYILSSLAVALLTTAKMNEFVPITFRGVFRRTNDIRTFVASRLPQQ